MGRKVEVNNISSYLTCRVVFYLMNLHTLPRPIWLTKHGQSEAEVHSKLGGDTTLTQLGDNYAHELAEWLSEKSKLLNQPIAIWTSTHKRCVQTCQYIPKSKLKLRQLDELDYGDYSDFTMEELSQRHPDEYSALRANPFTYRFTRGESYEDVIQRLVEPLIFEMENLRTPLLIVGNVTTLQCIYGYLRNRSPEECPFIEIPSHTVIELTPKAYFCDEKRHKLL